MPMPVSTPMRFPRTEIHVAGKTYGMLLDTGPAATIISRAVIEEWSNKNPDWPRHGGAHGLAEALARAGGQVLETLVAGELAWGPFNLGQVTMAAQREGVFEQYISQMMTAPVVGALGSNVFMSFRLELDYLNETLYISKSQ